MSDAIRQAAAAEIGKHRRLLRTGRDGRILSALMFPLLRRAPQSGYGVLTTTGRKTGKSRPKCVRVVGIGDRAYLVALHPPHLTLANPAAVQAWVHNIRANPNVGLRIGGGTFDGIAREITDEDEHERARVRPCAKPYTWVTTANAHYTFEDCPAERKSKSCTTTGSRPEFRL
jgi:deazaflavin-dependent oxidoreductase (nitroreductase family)